MAFRELVKSYSKSFSPFVRFSAKTEWLSVIQKAKLIHTDCLFSNNYQSSSCLSLSYFPKSATTCNYPNPLLNGNSRFQISKQSPLLSLSNVERSSGEVEFNSFNKEKYSISHQNNQFIDLFTNNAHKHLYMPTVATNNLKVYQDMDKLPKAIEDNRNIIQIIDPSAPEQLQKKEAVRMILIRRRKMRKHKLRKLRKRMKFVFAKRKLKRELRKEQAFRMELLSQVEAADQFDAKQYVENIMHTLRCCPKPETREESREKYRIKMKMNRYETNLIRPNFDD